MLVRILQFYSQGVFDWSGCSSTKLNHPLLLIGYGYTYVENVYTEYWLLKNRCGVAVINFIQCLCVLLSLVLAPIGEKMATSD